MIRITPCHTLQCFCFQFLARISCDVHMAPREPCNRFILNVSLYSLHLSVHSLPWSTPCIRTIVWPLIVHRHANGVSNTVGHLLRSSRLQDTSSATLFDFRRTCQYDTQVICCSPLSLRHSYRKCVCVCVYGDVQFAGSVSNTSYSLFAARSWLRMLTAVQEYIAYISAHADTLI